MNSYNLIQGDSFKVLPTLADNSIDLILTDPPYDLISSSWDKKIDWVSLSNELNRVLMDNGTLILFGKIPMLIDVYQAFLQKFDFRFEYIWEKQNMIWVSDYKPLPVHENIWTFAKKGITVRNLTFNIKAIARKGGYIRRGKTSSSETRSNMKPSEYRKKDYRMPRSVLKFKNMTALPSERLGHPTQKPEKLINFLIRGQSNKNDMILDPFLGSGTIMKISQDLSRSCIGIEIDPDFCEMTKTRCFQRRFLDRYVEYKFSEFKEDSESQGMEKKANV